MIFSNVSGSFVEGLLGKEEESAFVYQLKQQDPMITLSGNLEAVISVWLQVGEKLFPMVKLQVLPQRCRVPSALHIVYLFTGIIVIEFIPGDFPTGGIYVYGISRDTCSRCSVDKALQ
jgi:hypothetical protein